MCVCVCVCVCESAGVAGGCRGEGAGRMAFTALGKKLSLSLVVLEFMNLYRFLDGSGANHLSFRVGGVSSNMTSLPLESDR